MAEKNCLTFPSEDLKEPMFIKLPDGTEIHIEPDPCNTSHYFVMVLQGNCLVGINNFIPVMCWDRDAFENYSRDNILDISNLTGYQIKNWLPPIGLLIFNEEKTKVIGIGLSPSIPGKDEPTH